VFESPAIALYLTDKFPKNRLRPLVGERDRAAYLSWLCYYTGVLEPAFMSKFMHVEVPRGTAGWVPVEEAMPVISKALSPGPYILGERFSAADVLYGTMFAMFGQSPMMPKSTVIDDYEPCEALLTNAQEVASLRGESSNRLLETLEEWSFGRIAPALAGIRERHAGPEARR
jgi:glutathione S-transferase